jgi:hypothetical protein
MSRTVAESTARELEDITTQLAWRQWRAIGGSAATNAPWRSIVDPEALVLASLFLVDREPRITEILYSWVELNADLLSVQRMKNLQKDYPPQVQERVSAFAKRARAVARHPKWRGLSDDVAEPTFTDLPEVRRAARPEARHPTNLVLRLRLALGVGTKADVLALALGSERPLTVREMADALSYTAVGIRTAVSDLASAGFMVVAGGKPAAFTAPHNEWSQLLHLPSRPRWVAWHHWFALVIGLLASSEHAALNNLGEYATDVKIRQLIARHAHFFRSAAGELSAAAFRNERGTYPEVLQALLEWARCQERQPAV